MIVATGGNARGVGKTTLLCAILRAYPGWHALKVTPHDEHLSASGDTERFITAGALSAHLRSPTQLPSFEEGNWLIESNRILDLLTPDAYIFIQANQPEDEKPQSRWHLSRANVVLRDWEPSPHLPAEVSQLISSLLK